MSLRALWLQGSRKPGPISGSGSLAAARMGGHNASSPSSRSRPPALGSLTGVFGTVISFFQFCAFWCMTDLLARSMCGALADRPREVHLYACMGVCYLGTDSCMYNTYRGSDGVFSVPISSSTHILMAQPSISSLTDQGGAF